jgi:suppressor for copper-sensitivity B
MRMTLKTLVFCLAVISVVFFSQTAMAQSSLFDGNQGNQPSPPTPFPKDEGFFGAANKDIVKLNARFTTPTDKQPAILFVTAEIKKGWHIYSITQAQGGPIASKILLVQSPQYRLASNFQSNPEPKKGKEPDAFGDLVVESHYESVTWYAPIELAQGVDLGTLRIDGKVTVQPCDANACLPPQDIIFSAVRGTGISVPNEQPNIQSQPVQQTTPALPTTSEQPATSANTSTEPSPQVVPMSTVPLDGSSSKTKLSWRPFTKASFKQLVGPTYNEELLKQNIANRLKANNLWSQVLLGFLGGIILNLMPCVLPVIGLKILAFVEQSGDSRGHGFMLNLWYSAGLISVFLLLAALAIFANLGWGQLFQYPAFNVAMAVIIFVMGLSFLGIWEIPIPGFVGRGTAVSLAEREGFSGAFAKGIVTTILATPCTGPFMASALAWAVSQPAQNTFLVFFSVGLGMASPYLLIGAFPELIRFLPKPGAWMDTFKHIMGFVLMATVVYIFTFLDWAYVVPTVGLLMAFWAGCWWIGRTPLFANFDAKLAAWLQAGAFVAVMWVLLFPGLSGLTRGRIEWNGLYGVMSSRLKESRETCIQQHLESLQLEGYELVRNSNLTPIPVAQSGPTTVMVDFTADWCPTCKVLEATVLNSAAVKEKVEQDGVVTMKADWTHQPPEITAMLDLLASRQVPVLAIFPAGKPNDPIIFLGGYTQQTLIKALDEAKTPKNTL